MRGATAEHRLTLRREPRATSRPLKRRNASQSRIAAAERKVDRARRSYEGAVSANPSIKAMQRSLDKVRRDGGKYRLRPSQPRITYGPRRQRGRLLSLNKHLPKLRDQLGPERGHPLAQQRPCRGHAGPLHRAEVAPRRRPTTRSCNPRLLQKDASGDDDAQLRLPVGLPQRPEPDPPPGPRDAGRAPRPRPPLRDRRGIPDEGPLHPLQRAGRGLGVKPRT